MQDIIFNHRDRSAAATLQHNVSVRNTIGLHPLSASMSLAMTHFAIGAGLMQLALLALDPSVRYRESLIVASGLWALVPDLHYVVPVFNEQLSQIKASILGNLFWFHAALDSFRQGRGTRGEAALALLFLVVATVVSEWVRTSRDRSGSGPDST